MKVSLFLLALFVPSSVMGQNEGVRGVNRKNEEIRRTRQLMEDMKNGDDSGTVLAGGQPGTTPVTTRSIYTPSPVQCNPAVTWLPSCPPSATNPPTAPPTAPPTTRAPTPTPPPTTVGPTRAPITTAGPTTTGPTTLPYDPNHPINQPPPSERRVCPSGSVSEYYAEIAAIGGPGPKLVVCTTNEDCTNYTEGGEEGPPCCIWPQCLCGFKNPSVPLSVCVDPLPAT